MKKNYLFTVAFGAAVLAGCSQDEQLNMVQETRSGFTGVLELSESRTTLGDDYIVNWEANEDQVSIFELDDQNTQYKVKSVSGGVAQFEFVDYIEKENPVTLDAYYSVYPYDDANSISEEGVISATVPSTIEDYSSKDDAINQALMVAKSTTTDLKFTNAQGLLLLRLNAQKPGNYGAIKSITLTSTKYNLAGTATMSWADGVEKPEAKIGQDGTKELTINLASELQTILPRSTTGNYAEYYIPVVPTTFEKNEDGTGDVTMTITWTSGEAYVKNIGLEFAVGRNKIKPLKHTVGLNNFTGTTEGVESAVSTVEELLNALANGGNVTLQSDITLTDDVEIAAGVTSKLNLNGNTLSTAGNSISVKGNLTVSNGVVETESGEEDLEFAFAVSAGGSLNIESDAEVAAKENGTAAVYMDGGELNVDGTIEVDGAENCGVFMYGTEATININGTITTGENAYAIKQLGGTTNVSVGENGSLGKSTLEASGTMNLTYVCATMPVVETDGTNTDLNITATVKDADALAKAVAAGATDIIISQDMTLTANSLANASNDLTINLAANTTVTVASGAAASKNLTFTGDESSTVTFVNTNPGYEGKLAYHDNANLTFQGITFDASQISGICARGGIVNFVDCFITGEFVQTIASKFEFTRCNFDVGVTQVGYGCPEVVFDGCTFETDGYGIKIYKEANDKNVNLTVKGCSFKNTGSEARSAILLDHIINGFTYNITVETCTFEGYTATPTATYNKWAARMIVADSFVKTADGQYIFSYQTGAEGGNYHKLLTAEQLVVTVK